MKESKETIKKGEREGNELTGIVKVMRREDNN